MLGKSAKALMVMERHAALSRAQMITWTGNAVNYAAAEHNMNEALEAWLRIRTKMLFEEMI